MSLSLNQTIHHLKSLMAHVKDAVFPDYSDVATEYALDGIRTELSAVSSKEIAAAFMEQFPEVRRLVLTDVEAISENDPAVTGMKEIVFCYPAVTAMLYYRTAHVLLGLGAFLILMFRNAQAAQPYFRHLEMIGFSQKDTKRLFKLENHILYLSAAIPALLVLLLLAAFAPIHLPTVLIGWVLLTAAGLVVVEMR